MKSLKYVLAFSFLLLLNHKSFSQNNNLEDLINEAIAVSPKIKMLEAKLDAASNRINTNSNLPDPMLTLGLMNMPVNSFSFTLIATVCNWQVKNKNPHQPAYRQAGFH